MLLIVGPIISLNGMPIIPRDVKCINFTADYPGYHGLIINF